MKPTQPTHASRRTVPFQGSAVWLRLSLAAALLSIAGSIIALTRPGIYARLTPAFLPQALAQDIANLAVTSPACLVLIALAWRGSLRAYLLWLGVLIFTVYNYVIYTFSVPFGALFLLWVAVLGLSAYSLIGGIACADHAAVKTAFASRRAAAAAAWCLIAVAALFALLWLSEDVPALLSGSTPQSVIDMGVPTNAVHVLDLSFFLPAAVATGWLLLRRAPLSYTLAPAFIVFLVLTGIPILLTPVIQSARGQAAGWGVVAPIGIFTVLLLCLLAWLVSTIRSAQRGDQHGTNG